MSTHGDYLNHLTLDDYAREAFCHDPERPNLFAQGGIYAGKDSLYASPWDRKVSAKARLVKIAPGKIFVRWVDSKFGDKWENAAGGAWWSSDRGADQIVRMTIAKYGLHGDTSLIAREFSNVGYTTDDGQYRSNMRTVVVCQTTEPITVLMGVGRPVTNPTLQARGTLESKDMIGEELQIVILTRMEDRSQPASASYGDRFPFLGGQYFKHRFFSSSTALTSWWMNEDPVGSRRQAKIATSRGAG